MSRSGYSDDCDDQWAWIRWRGAVASAIRGKRGQAFFREMLEALDAMEDKRLHYHVLARGPSGPACAMGVVVQKRGLDVTELENRIEDGDDEFDSYSIGAETAAILDIPRTLACEIAYINDEGGWHDETPEGRWLRMRTWVASQIK